MLFLYKLIIIILIRMLSLASIVTVSYVCIFVTWCQSEFLLLKPLFLCWIPVCHGTVGGLLCSLHFSQLVRLILLYWNLLYWGLSGEYILYSLLATEKVGVWMSFKIVNNPVPLSFSVSLMIFRDFPHLYLFSSVIIFPSWRIPVYLILPFKKESCVLVIISSQYYYSLWNFMHPSKCS